MANLKLDRLFATVALALCLLAWSGSSLAVARVLHETDQQEQRHASEEKAIWRPGSGQSLDSLLDSDDPWPVLCPPDNWYSKKQESCIPCTQCSEGYEMTRPCYRFQDTRCAPSDDLRGHLVSLTPRRRGHLGRLGRGANDDAAKWRPVVLALGVITGVLLIALLIASATFYVLWRRQAAAAATESSSSEKKLVCSYSPAPSATV